MNAPLNTALLAPQSLDYHQVAALVPYGAPWLLIDRVLRWDDQSIVVQKALSGSDSNMSAHLKTGPSIAPGVLQIEFVGQAIMVLVTLLNMKAQRRDLVAGAPLLARCKAQFHSPAYIGEVITASARIEAILDGKTAFEGVVKAGDRMVSTISGIGAQVTAPLASTSA